MSKHGPLVDEPAVLVKIPSGCCRAPQPSLNVLMIESSSNSWVSSTQKADGDEPSPGDLQVGTNLPPVSVTIDCARGSRPKAVPSAGCILMFRWAGVQHSMLWRSFGLPLYISGAPSPSATSI